MVTNNFVYSDLPRINHIVQNAMTLYPKELVVETLRDYFSRDAEYHYVADHWGNPKTPDLKDHPLDAGYGNDLTTRIFIGEKYRYNVVYYPCILVANGGATSVPISFNREASSIKWDQMVFEDGYGNITTFPVPSYFIFAGAWEGSITLDIKARDLRTRDELVDLVSQSFVDTNFNDLAKSGLVIKAGGVSSSAPSEIDDRNDKLFMQTVTLQVRSEWRRHIPINNIIDIINMSIEFGEIGPPPGPIAPNLTINVQESIVDILANL
jgi:hypothetical protein